jgi:hypothetical protein
MSADHEVALATKEFPSTNELEIFESFIGKHIEGSLDSGSRFWGTLEGVTECLLCIRGVRGQVILIKKRKVSRLMEAV